MRVCYYYLNVVISSRGTPPKDVINKFWQIFNEHRTAASSLADKALHISTGILDQIPWAAAFLPPSDPRSRRMLADLLHAYILAVEGKSGWKLEIDSRL